MGTGFTIDTPLKVARYGISSVISLVDDVLIEQMRRFHCERHGEPYEAIGDRDEDHRARRITAYLDLLDRLVARQVHALQAAPFEPDSEITRYYEMLPEGSRRQTYRRMLETGDAAERARLQESLRRLAVPGTIDVNIMTKLDRDTYRGTQPLAPEYRDAMSALRGYARSTVASSIVFSAGMNAGLYTYTAQFDDFFPDAGGRLKKQIILKVSDFRSAAIQGKFLAKRGLWVSEYRIESGLNCGGHAFPTQGLLMGPILDEFRLKRQELAQELREVCNTALQNHGRRLLPEGQSVRLTVQGGIGTAEEQSFLFSRYGVDGTGWGTPFLLVPEATQVDPVHLQRLAAAREDEVRLSNASPLGIPFWILTTAASEESRRERIRQGRPGSPCPKGYLALNKEFSAVPICSASQAYQRLKLRTLETSDLPEAEKARQRETVLAKSCICHDLAGGAALNSGVDPAATTAVCCGPNIVNFSKIASLREMIDHIYGRRSLLAHPDRPHMFLQEISLYVDYLRQEAERTSAQWTQRAHESLTEFKENLLSGLAYYQSIADQLAERRQHFIDELDRFRQQIQAISIPQPVQA